MPVTFSVSGDNEGAGLRGEAGAGAGRQAAGSQSRGEDRAGAGACYQTEGDKEEILGAVLSNWKILHRFDAPDGKKQMGLILMTQTKNHI